MGFLIKAFDENEMYVGSFKSTGSNSRAFSHCAGITHTWRNLKKRVVVQWLAPEDRSGKVHFNCNGPDLREIIRDVVREEIRKLLPAAASPDSPSIAEVVRAEVQQALQPQVLVSAAPEPPTLSYAAATRRPPPPAHPYAAPPRREPPAPQFSRRQEDQAHAHPEPAAPRKTDVWRTADRCPLCYHCGEAGHIYRRCPYRQLGLRGFHPNNPRPSGLRDILEKEHHIAPTVLLAPGRVVEKEGESKAEAGHSSLASGVAPPSNQRAPAGTSSKRKRETALGSLLKVFADMKASRKQRHKDRMALLGRLVTAIEKSAPAE
ncbi:hypothetical protein HPB47_010559 [Ixodes persulcatus]|uniref:Uncharacterized protein n=1 Tax=Ixodes persulcatus TaxID=34615 RepID=A0AC60NYS0_IXOPE|nr:hypothetical protein HPB47_010559 [Ixodes persulcatus]